MRLQFGDCIFDSDTRELFREGRPVHVSPKAFRLLELLLKSRPKALSKAQIHEAIWPDAFVSEATLASLIAEIREAIGDADRESRLLRTVHGFGYAFPAAVKELRATPSQPFARTEFRMIWGDREIALEVGENLIGRDHDVAIWLDEENVSRHHASVRVSEDGAILEDLKSKNGTYLNGRRLREAVALSDGDELRVASVLLPSARCGRSGRPRRKTAQEIRDPSLEPRPRRERRGPTRSSPSRR